MKVYWDTSTIIWHYARGRMADIKGVTRPHTLAEAYSALTGGGFDLVLPDGRTKHKRLSMQLAAAVLERIHPQLEYIQLSANEVVNALKTARSKGAQGGRIHDLLHMVAAEKAKADELWTLDENDFERLGTVPLKYLAGKAASGQAVPGDKGSRPR